MDTTGIVAEARSQTLGDLLRRSAARHPDKTALVWRGRRESFAELDAAVNRVAHSLADRGVGQGDRVALYTHNCREFVLLYFALARLGAISVPINFMLTGEEVAYILEHSGAVGLIIEDALGAEAEAAVKLVGDNEIRLFGWIGSGGLPVPGGWEDVAAWEGHADATEPGVRIGDDDPVQLMYTSGTESRPKGAIMTSRGLIAQYVSAVVDGRMSVDDVEVHALPLYHCAQLHCFLTPDIYLGATSILLPGPDPATVLRTIETERATKLFCPPTVWVSLLRHPEFDSYDLSSLRKGYYGASIMPVEVLHELADRLPGVRLANFYGQTELAPLATVLAPEDQLTKPGSAGRPALNVETRVVDDDGVPVGPGVVGEIVHRSPQAMLGYWNDPEKTADAFRDGWFHSGDLGVVDADGYLSVVDRKKDMIKTGGENVASREVEEVLYQHPDVSEAAVVGIAHPHWIEAVAAVVVPRVGSRPIAEDLIAHCRQRLAGYKVPKYVVLADALPKNPSGKILKRELRSTYGDLAVGG
ncbi:long-chain-fatty-acid--CoA ligase [Nocardia otitidiscaviarum]|uniref:Long-chain-fatty-acid--CoA ligase n=1 Tax=Nocardia otitidiscaviarum TaxID=1823 RepID=A0A516NNR7_9NOCA|nr:acyl-CoA synthetase [Nocardia otitidiscaviarum]MCP9619787.1 acyl-CoA synthetase [Nocardia otitidiscaviarum]QDP80539.1 long-chain-fatty-acid--CoA ligase [Nocardia otitidiscaviarum]